MFSWNKIFIIGNLGNDPEMRMSPQGKQITNFSVAVNRNTITESGDTKRETDWFRVKTWGRLAETCNQFLSKGRAVLVEGSIHISQYEKDGVKQMSAEVSAERVVFLSVPQGRKDETEEPIGEE